MVQVGNVNYQSEIDLPSHVPIFPLDGVLLLPQTQLPLQIYEPRYLDMIEDAFAGSRIIGMIQPAFAHQSNTIDGLSPVGGLGRITSISESGDGRYLILLDGICRFRIISERQVKTSYRCADITPFVTDLLIGDDDEIASRKELMSSFSQYVDAYQYKVDLDELNDLNNVSLINALSMQLPFDAAEKQMLLEAADLETRSQSLIAIMEMAVKKSSQAHSPGGNDFIQ